MLDPIALSPRPFVHDRQTVRTSERMAEIWVSLPEGDQSTVFVNHVEYPPEGEFRIFRTKLNSKALRRFYLSAKWWDVVANRWVKLNQDYSTQLGVIAEVGYVTLVPGQRVEVKFLKLNPPTTEEQAPPPAAQADLEAALSKHLDPINNRLDRIEKNELKLALLDKATTTLNTAANNLNAPSVALQNHLRRLKHAAAPNVKSGEVTKQFQFDLASMHIAGDADALDQKTINSITWTNHPASLVIAVSKSVKALPARPFPATVRFWRKEKTGKRVLEPIDATFHDVGNDVVAEIPFHHQLAVPLTKSLKEHATPGSVCQLGATLEYSIDLGDLDPVHVAGPLGNEIELTIAP